MKVLEDLLGIFERGFWIGWVVVLWIGKVGKWLVVVDVVDVRGIDEFDGIGVGMGWGVVGVLEDRVEGNL